MCQLKVLVCEHDYKLPFLRDAAVAAKQHLGLGSTRRRARWLSCFQRIASPAGDAERGVSGLRLVPFAKMVALVHIGDKRSHFGSTEPLRPAMSA